MNINSPHKKPWTCPKPTPKWECVRCKHPPFNKVHVMTFGCDRYEIKQAYKIHDGFAGLIGDGRFWTVQKKTKSAEVLTKNKVWKWISPKEGCVYFPTFEEAKEALYEILGVK